MGRRAACPAARPGPGQRGSSAKAAMVPPSSTWCYVENMSNLEITQRDLRSRSREIMDAVEHGQSFTVTRDGRRIGELIPLRRRRRFVPREEFSAMSRNAPAGDLDAFRSDQDAVADHETASPYER
jgi:prevent-host-death family protein